jgi:hypothetical protein|tara:strand:- start:57 stop:287 length:231 start_codon:yes stop_codon:yes gene_type:complete
MIQENYTVRMVAHLDTVVTLRLVTVLEDIEAANDAANIPFYDAVSVALSFMLSPEELANMETREIPQAWLETLANV